MGKNITLCFDLFPWNLFCILKKVCRKMFCKFSNGLKMHRNSTAINMII